MNACEYRGLSVHNTHPEVCIWHKHENDPLCYGCLNEWMISYYVAKKWQRLHRNHSTERFFKDKNIESAIGIYGEIRFGSMYGLAPNLREKIQGDDYDFLVHGKKVDVKTARKPLNLLVKEFEIGKCDIYVNSRFDEAKKAVTFLGWETSQVMKEQPQRDFGYGIVNYYKKTGLLKPMEDLGYWIRYGGQGTANL